MLKSIGWNKYQYMIKRVINCINQQRRTFITTTRLFKPLSTTKPPSHINKQAITRKQMESLPKKQEIDKTKFNKEISVIGIRVPVKQIKDVMNKFSDMLLAMRSVKVVLPIQGDDSRKCVLLRKDQDNQRIEDFAKENAYELTEEKVTQTYENLSMNDVLKQLLPADIEEIPSGFETIGDIAHLNLTGRLFDEYRYLIGQVVLEKNPMIRSVVTKIGQIESTFRFYDLECIAGDSTNYEAMVLEDKVKFKVDVSRVYWCSKLGSERTRMIDSLFHEGDVLCDMFCGIGPLAVKAAVKKRVKVLANDLNPACFEYLNKNIQLNRVQKLVIPFNMDARAFVKHCVDASNDPLQKIIPEDFLRFDHCYMNLPVDAVEFLDAFIGLFNNANPKVWAGEDGEIKLPMIHVYGFTFEHEEAKAKEYFVNRIGAAMKYKEFEDKDVVHFQNIRTVSPQSIMYGTSFRLPKAVAFATSKQEHRSEEEKQDIYNEFEDKSRTKVLRTDQ